MKKSKKNRCQCCNKTFAAKIHLVFGDEGKKRNIAAVLLDYIGKSLNELDGIKYGICDPCWQQLIQYNEFKEKCIRANEATSDDDENDIDNDYDNIEDDEASEQNESSSNVTGYMLSEYLDESQYEYLDDSEDMTVEYLDESDSFGEEHVRETNTEIERKKVQFDFTSIIVKPIFMLEIGKYLILSTFLHLVVSSVLIEKKINGTSLEMF